jgi:beta-lactamase regulating signal transducer with metallopeptidase domain
MIVIPVLDASANFSAHLLQPAARSLAFACFAGLALAAFRVRQVALRLAIWRAVLLVALAMPLLGLLLPPLPVFVPLAAKFLRAQPPAEIVLAHGPQSRANIVNQVAHSSSTKVGAFGSSPQASDATGAINETSAPVSTEVSSDSMHLRPPFPWLAASAAIYLAVAIFMLIRLALGIILGRRLEREARPIDDPHALARLHFFNRAAGLCAAPRLAESDLLSVPVTFGVPSPAILLPPDWRNWEPAELDAVLAHEISHVVRRDALAERLALLHRAIFWFSPLSWWLARHLADLAEEASDDAALAAGADRTRYAETLLGFFAALEAAPGRVWWQGVSMATAGQAEKRVDRILEWKGSVAMRLKKPVVIAYLIAAIPVVCLIAAFRPTMENFHATRARQTAPQTTQPPAVPAAPSVPPTQANAPQQPTAPVGAPELPSLPSVGPMPPLTPVEPVVSVHTIVKPFISVDPEVSVHTVVRPLVLPVVTPLVMPSVAPMVSVVPIVPVPPVGGPVSSVVPVFSVHPLVPRWLQSTTIHGTRIGDYNEDTFAIVSGKSYVSVSSSSTSMGTDASAGPAGSDSGSGFVDSLRHSFPGDFIWFIRDGKAYIIRDPATIKQAMDFFAPSQALGRQQDELGNQQEALGAQQETLGARQEALGEQMEKVRVQIPDMTAELQKLEAELKKLGTDGTPDDLSRIQEKISEIQERIGELQSKAGEKQSELGEQQGALGEEQGKLGKQQGKLGELQGKLGEQQEKASKNATREMKKLLDQAVASGLAKPA